MKTLPCMGKHYNGSHWGLTDLYPEIREGILTAIESDEDWTTGWWSSKKEIASAKISREEGVYTIEALVTNDFDTDGYGSAEFTPVVGALPEIVYNALLEMVDDCWRDAIAEQKNNSTYQMFSIHNQSGRWVETYLLNLEDEFIQPAPPGDCYHEWGWQEESDEIPAEDKQAIEDQITACRDDATFTVGDWTVKRVDD